MCNVKDWERAEAIQRAREDRNAALGAWFAVVLIGGVAAALWFLP